jgi:hypothetical protein
MTRLIFAISFFFLTGHDLRAQSSELVVKQFCDAMASLDANQMFRFIKEDYYLVDTEGNRRLYNRKLAETMCKWEKEMDSKWTFEILGVDGNTVTVLLKEYNAYYTLLGLGHSIQVSQYTVENGKIQKSQSRLFITEKSSQSVEFNNFRVWLFDQKDLNEPSLIRPDSSIAFDGQSALAMRKWLQRYSKSLEKK